MTRLWLGFALVIAYGSIYPFEFESRVLNDATIQRFLDSCCKTPHGGDILANIILFFPFGYLGILSAKNGDSLIKRCWLVCLSGVVLAFVLQVAQIWLPSRNESLQDVLWNFFGILAGMGLGVLTHGYILNSVFRLHKGALAPSLLICSWLAYRWVPFVPSLSFDSIKDSVRPLINNPQIDLVSTFHDAIAWLVVAALLQRIQKGAKLDRYLPVLILGSFCLEILIVSNVLHASSLAGAVLALAWWWGGVKYLRWQAGALAALLGTMLVVSGLAPFSFTSEPATFGWLPFYGLLGGSMYVNVLAICEKVFLYGSIVYLLWQTRLNPVAGTAGAALLVLFVEIAQLFVIRRTPEITDPLLVIVAAFMMVALRQHEEAAAPTPEEKTRKRRRRSRSAPRSSLDPVSDMMVVSVNLRHQTADFLDRLSAELGVGMTETCRQVIDRMLARAAEPADTEAGGETGELSALEQISARLLAADDGPAPSEHDWTKRTIALERPLYLALRNQAEESEQSVSRTVRHLLAAFIDQTTPGGAKPPVPSRQQAADSAQLKQDLADIEHRSSRPSRTKTRAERKKKKPGAGAILVIGLTLLTLSGAGLLFLFTGTTTSGPAIVTAIPWAGRGAEVIFDHHSHTVHSDGKLSVSDLVDLARDGGCDALAITDHSDTGRKRPFRLGEAAGGTVSDRQLAEFETMRQRHLGFLLFGGVEINMPSYEGREHATVIVEPANEGEILPSLRDAAEDSIDKGRSGSGEGASDDDFLALAATHWRRGNKLVMIYNHPSRRDRDPDENYEDLRRWNADSPLFIGFAGAPGHQNARNLGGYRGKLRTVDRWDPVVAEVGGTWDRLLSDGEQVWGAMAGSDFHNQNIDKVPCSFARTHVEAAEFSYGSVLEALRAGSFWADHGQILRQLSLTVEVPGLATPASPGVVVQLGSQPGVLIARVDLERGPGSEEEPLQVEFIGNCRSGEAEVLTAEDLVAVASSAVARFAPGATGADGESCYLRARVRLKKNGEPDLMAYTNHIRLLLP